MYFLSSLPASFPLHPLFRSRDSFFLYLHARSVNYLPGVVYSLARYYCSPAESKQFLTRSSPERTLVVSHHTRPPHFPAAFFTFGNETLTFGLLIGDILFMPDNRQLKATGFSVKNESGSNSNARRRKDNVVIALQLIARGDAQCLLLLHRCVRIYAFAAHILELVATNGRTDGRTA